MAITVSIECNLGPAWFLTTSYDQEMYIRLINSTLTFKNRVQFWGGIINYHKHKVYRMMGYFRVAKFSRFFVSKTWGLIFADFNFRGRQRPRKMISILFHENHRVGGTARISLDRSTVRKENLRPKYLKRKGIKDTCILTDKQAKRTYIHSEGWIKWLFRTKQWNVCLVTWTLKVVSYDTFAIKQLVVYSECNINANILFNKETKTITCVLNTITKEN